MQYGNINTYNGLNKLCRVFYYTENIISKQNKRKKDMQSKLIVGRIEMVAQILNEG